MGCSQSKSATTTLVDTIKREPQALLNPIVNLVKDVFDPTKIDMGARRLRNIFATPLELLDVSSYTLPDFEKTEEETVLIRAALKKNFVFDHLTPDECEPFVKAFEKVNFTTNEKIIVQGDVGDFFYVIGKGTVIFQVNGKTVGEPATKGASFGELALLYQAPRAATVIATTDLTLFRVDQKAFRFILRKRSVEDFQIKYDLIAGPKSAFKDLTPQDKKKLVQLMVAQSFKKGDQLISKGTKAQAFYVVQEGELKATEIGDAANKYSDMTVGPGDQMGQVALLKDQPYQANVVALNDGKAYRIDRDTFKTVFGDYDEKMRKALMKKQLSIIKVIKDLNLGEATLDSLAACIKEKTFAAGTKIIEEGKQTRPAIYLVRNGNGAKLDKKGQKVVELGEFSYFGDEMLLADSDSKPMGAMIPAPYTILVSQDMTVGVLSLKDCRNLIDTSYFGKGPYTADSIRLKTIVKLEDLTRHRILGAGTFGQVWLVSRVSSGGSRRAYALKVQSKYELVQSGQARAVVDEKNIMKILKHPFLATLEASFHDDQFVYILMKLVQGGELYSVMQGKMPESKAKFYIYGISEGLAFMHRRGYVYRDLKPENVLISDTGYPVIIDYGFVKYITDKTFTLCGTPLYIAPEVIQNRGHDWGADHWSMGVLIYEMLSGDNPFYKDYMDQMQLFQAIIKGRFDMPTSLSDGAKDIIRGLLQREPTRRLGSLANDEDDILNHKWFTDLDKDKYLSMEVKAPYVPDIKDPFDGSNFDNWSHLDDKLKTKYPSLSPKDAKVFADF